MRSKASLMRACSEGKKPSRKPCTSTVASRTPSRKKPGCLGLATAFLLAAEHDPAHGERRALADEAQDGAAAADLDIIGMSAEAQQAERLVAGREAELEHPLRLNRRR